MQQRPRPPVRHARRPPREVIIRRRVTVFGGLGVVLALILYSIVASVTGSSPSTTTTTTSVPTATHQVTATVAAIGVKTFIYTDTTRSTLSYVTDKTTKGRTISVEVRYPAKVSVAPTSGTVADAAIVKRTKYPLILFAPGFRLQPSDYDALLDGWVHNGYLVATVSFPDTSAPAADAPYKVNLPYGSPEADLYSEPGDLAFALSSLEASSKTSYSWLSGLVNAHKVVLAGHSDGGSAVAALVYDEAYAKAGLGVSGVVVLSGAEFSLANQTYGQPAEGAVPLLVVQSNADLCDAPDNAVVLYNAIGAPKYFDELEGATHIGMVNGSDAAAFGVVQKTTAAFFANALGIGNVTADQLTAAGTKANVSTITSVATAAPIAAPSGAASCPTD